MKGMPTIDDLAARFMFMPFEKDAFFLIQEACSMCSDRADPRAEAASVIETYLSWGLGYATWTTCGWCLKDFHPAPYKSLRRFARRYVDFVLDDCAKFSNPFHRCKACGGKLPFDDETSGANEGEPQ